MRKIRIIMYIAIAVCLLAVGYHLSTKGNYIKKNGIKTQGYVLQKAGFFKKTNSEITFKTLDGKEIVSTYSALLFFSSIGDKKTIYYLPNDPKQTTDDSIFKYRFLPYVISLFVFCGLYFELFKGIRLLK